MHQNVCWVSRRNCFILLHYFEGFGLHRLLSNIFCIDSQKKSIGCWPRWRSHRPQTVGFQAIIGAGVEVCSRVDSSGKVKVHFIYQDFSSYQTQQWANWYFRSLKLPFNHKTGTLCFQQWTGNTFALWCNIVGSTLSVTGKKVDYVVAIQRIPYPLMAIWIWIAPSKSTHLFIKLTYSTHIRLAVKASPRNQ